MSCFDFKGGIGTASRLIPDTPYTVGVLAMCNFGERERLTVDGVPVGRLLPLRPEGENAAPFAGSCIVIVLTDAPLTSHDLPAPGRAGPGSAWRGPGRPRTTDPARSSWPPRPVCGRRAATSAPIAAAAVTPSAEPTSTRSSRRSSTPPRSRCSIACCRRETVTGRSGNTSPGLPADAVKELLSTATR